ncbi:unannotated protein [freshwater metagenome]|uniref:Unannotated protein n=1 Tax=freshwater metagenome TaxID=449393 RepID=A0A6J6QA89_9ZZZZ
MPQAIARGSDCIRASTAPVSATRSRPGPKESADWVIRVGPVRMAEKPARVPASAHTSMLIREAKTPVIWAASGLAAAARTARPYRLRLRKTPTARTASGAKTSIAKYDGVTSSAPTENCGRKSGDG